MVALSVCTFISLSLFFAAQNRSNAFRIASGALFFSVLAAWIVLQGFERGLMLGLAVVGLTGMTVVLLGTLRPKALALTCLAVLILFFAVIPL